MRSFVLAALWLGGGAFGFTGAAEQPAAAPRGFLGVGLHRVTVMGTGRLVIGNGTVVPAGAVWIAQVVDDTPAQKAGLQANDIIIAVDGRPWTTGLEEFTKYVQAKHPGDHLKLGFLRKNATTDVEVVLAAFPDKR